MQRWIYSRANVGKALALQAERDFDNGIRTIGSRPPGQPVRSEQLGIIGSSLRFEPSFTTAFVPTSVAKLGGGGSNGTNDGIRSLIQFFHQVGAVADVQGGGVTYTAPVGGFIFGVIAARIFEIGRTA